MNKKNRNGLKLWFYMIVYPKLAVVFGKRGLPVIWFLVSFCAGRYIYLRLINATWFAYGLDPFTRHKMIMSALLVTGFFVGLIPSAWRCLKTK